MDHHFRTNVQTLFDLGRKYEFTLKSGVKVKGVVQGIIQIDDKWVINIIDDPSEYLRRVVFSSLETWIDITEQ